MKKIVVFGCRSKVLIVFFECLLGLEKNLQSNASTVISYAQSERETSKHYEHSLQATHVIKKEISCDRKGNFT